jgi:hypothetical protein
LSQYRHCTIPYSAAYKFCFRKRGYSVEKLAGRRCMKFDPISKQVQEDEKDEEED